MLFDRVIILREYAHKMFTQREKSYLYKDVTALLLSSRCILRAFYYISKNVK